MAKADDICCDWRIKVLKKTRLSSYLWFIPSLFEQTQWGFILYIYAKRKLKRKKTGSMHHLSHITRDSVFSVLQKPKVQSVKLAHRFIPHEALYKYCKKISVNLHQKRWQTSCHSFWCKFALTVLLKQFEDANSPVINVKDFYLLLLKLFSGSIQSNRLYLTLKAPIATKVICFSRLLKCLRSLYDKQCGSRSDCSYRSSLIWVHPVCFYT